MALEDLLGKVLDEKYRLEEKLGQGGMGAVYLATHLGTERPVAVKIIAPQFMRHPEFVERFKREAKAAGRLRHPNVVDVTDFGFAQLSNDRIAYLVMEYLDGCTLSEVLAEEGKLPLKFAVNILEQVCAAIDTAHQQGIIHRDLKPDNIWLEPDGLGSYNIKVLDFGLAKLGEIQPQLANGEKAIFEAEEDCFIQKIFNKGCEDNSKQPNVIAKTAPQAIAATSSISLATVVKPSLEFSESATAVQPLLNSKSNGSSHSLELDETPTAIQTSSSNDDTQTQVQIRRNTANIGEDKIALVTHVGTVLGTPIYMSPEQCKGEKLDTRSDIYSLGIIAYQMLTGNTPFSGDTQALITHHTKTTPQNIRELRRDIPKAVSTLIMSALAKNPLERPATVSAFSNALQARSQGATSLLRQAISLYNNHFPVFLRISLIGYAPLIVMSSLMLFNLKILVSVLPKPLLYINSAIMFLAMVLSGIFAEAVIHSGIVPVVAQLLVAPFKPVSLRPILMSLKTKIVPLATTSLLFHLFVFLWSLLFFIPGVKALINYILFKQVIMMEGLKNKAALARSKALVNRLPMVTVKILVIKILLVSSLAINIGSLGSYKMVFHIQKAFSLSKTNASLFSIATMVLITPLLSITLALLYLKLRQAGGETFKEALGQFGEETPRSKWQLRMRERSRAYYRVNSQ